MAKLNGITGKIGSTKTWHIGYFLPGIRSPYMALFFPKFFLFQPLFLGRDQAHIDLAILKALYFSS